MSDRDLQAPWVGKCKEEYYGESEPEVIGYCDFCDEPLYEDGVYKTSMGDRVCRECYKRFEEELYEDDENYDVCDGCICEECHAKHEEDEED